ncbi:major facilitator superfamily domain-containing protein 1-like isoform X1 [Dreissena polymorpha]|uniref:major facilitator superfamily domain-containing protein 1-like isoform X1 n=1 Tax=Dreissena polymorpha TaxID=45954 RepID=UPI0022641096|nr:major facilitator superfamily domain-containing protein 1-like isoform X1 [Dreissena polymorpha]
MTRLVLGLTSHIMMTFTFVEPYVCTVILSLGYSLVTTTCWPLVSYAVPLRYITSALRSESWAPLFLWGRLLIRILLASSSTLRAIWSSKCSLPCASSMAY